MRAVGGCDGGDGGKARETRWVSVGVIVGLCWSLAMGMIFGRELDGFSDMGHVHALAGCLIVWVCDAWRAVELSVI